MLGWWYWNAGPSHVPLYKQSPRSHSKADFATEPSNTDDKTPSKMPYGKSYMHVHDIHSQPPTNKANPESPSPPILDTNRTPDFMKKK
eukprot:tig00000949_g5727.t1